MDAWPLSGKVMLITGGARGIGAATARELARRGALPVLADLDIDALAATAVAISPTPVTVELDVTDMDACEAAVQRVLEEHGRLDVVWANAGIGSGGPLQLADPAAWRRTVEVNLLGAYNTVRTALPAVIAQRGYVAVTASLASFAHGPYMSAYCATKAGVEAMANSLRIEVAHHGVNVATIHPTWIDTDMVRETDDLPTFQLLRRCPSSTRRRGPFRIACSTSSPARTRSRPRRSQGRRALRSRRRPGCPQAWRRSCG